MVIASLVTYVTRAAADIAVADLRFPLWLRLLPALGGWIIALIAVPFWFRRRRWLAARMVIFGLFCAFIVTPIMWRDRIIVSATSIEQPSQMIGPRWRGFRFADVDSIIMTSERDKRGDRQEVWYAHGHNGRVSSFVAGDLWRYHRDSIMTLLRASKVDIRSRVDVAAH